MIILYHDVLKNRMSPKGWFGLPILKMIQVKGRTPLLSKGCRNPSFLMVIRSLCSKVDSRESTEPVIFTTLLSL